MAAVRRSPPRCACTARRSRGLSLVELLVGTALGLFVVAGVATLFANQLREQHALRREALLTQDLGSAADLIARDLRRAGHWGDAAAGVWSPDAAPRSNPYAAAAPMAAASDAASYSYSRDAVENGRIDANEHFGWRLRDGALELLLGGGGWQAVTDSSLLVVTEFSLAPVVETIDLSRLCTLPCGAAAASAGTCPPRQQVRSLAVSITAQSSTDASVQRSLHSRVRLRNDAIVGNCPA